MTYWLTDPRTWTWILQGLSATVAITLFGVCLGLLLGTLLAIGDLYGGKVSKGIISFYVEFFRGSPLFVQVFIAVYAVPALFNIRIDHNFLAFLVFGLNSAGYQKGYVKGAMQTVLDDQMTAGLSVGMSKWQTLRHVILPQAYRIVIPAWTNEFCSLTKSSSVLAYVGISFFASGISDLTSVGIAVSYQQFVILPVWIVIGLIYLAWITGFSKIMDTIYEKKKIPGIDLEIQS